MSKFLRIQNRESTSVCNINDALKGKNKRILETFLKNPIFMKKRLVRFGAYRTIKLAMKFTHGHQIGGAFWCIIPSLHSTHYKRRRCVLVHIFAMAESNGIPISYTFWCLCAKISRRELRVEIKGASGATPAAQKKHPS